ncbi:mitofilin family membrane protein [Jhaorihella thermophila]
MERQLGLRSVKPRAGDDADAILSRAEAALTGGDLNRALAELDALPQTARDAMSDWLAQARTRQAAIAAVDDLIQSLNTN